MTGALFRDSKLSKPAFSWLLAALTLAAGLKIALVLTSRIPFNSDQAIVGLMARHILNGERPIFFYGQAYMGSLDAWLVAAGFRLFGEVAWVINLIQGLLYAGTIFTTALIGWRIFKDARVGLVAVFLLAIPTVNVTLYTTISLGGYGEALLLGNLIVLAGLKIGEELRLVRFSPWHHWLVLGILCGLGFWVLGLTLVYTVPVVIYLLFALYKYQPRVSKDKLRLRVYLTTLVAIFGGATLGALPWWLYAFQQGLGQLISELSRGSNAGSLLGSIGQHLTNLVVLGSTVVFGFRPPWTLTWLGLPLVPFAAAFWVAVLVWTVKAFRSNDRTPEKVLLLGIMLALAFAFVISPFGGDPSGRYFLPFAIPLALFASDLIIGLKIRYGNIALGLAALIMIYNLWGTLDGILSFQPGITTRFDVVTQANQKTINDLISFLDEQGETRGYTNYWVAYPLAFFSKEELIFIPRLPYHSDFSYTPRDDRYPAYDLMVTTSPRVAYITTNFPNLDQSLREKFSGLGVAWKEMQLGDFRVFYALSDPVAPKDIGLGFANP